MEILTPILIVGIIGLLAGVILAVASIVMAVPKDEKAEALEEVLPGANCGACGFSGCPGYAAAMAKGEAQPGLCSPGGAEVAQKCAEILGGGDVQVEYKTALVHCLGSYDNTTDKMLYDGIQSCSAAAFLMGGVTSCRFGCMGLGDCQRACQYGAITVCNGLLPVRGGLPQGDYLFGAPEKAGGGAVLQLRQGQGHHGRVQHWVHRLWQVHAHLSVRRHHRGERPGQGGPPKVHRLRPVRGSLPPPCDCDAVKEKRAERKGRPAGRSFPFALLS